MRLLREFWAYTFVSAAAFAVDFALLAMLVQVFSWHYLPAASVGFFVGAVVAYLLSVRWVFSFRRVADWRAEMASFISIGAFGLMLNVGLLAAGVEWLGLHYLVAKIAAGAITLLVNYAARRLLLFTAYTAHSRVES